MIHLYSWKKLNKALKMLLMVLCKQVKQVLMSTKHDNNKVGLPSV